MILFNCCLIDKTPQNTHLKFPDDISVTTCFFCLNNNTKHKIFNLKCYKITSMFIQYLVLLHTCI